MTSTVAGELKGFDEMVRSERASWLGAAAVIVGDRGRSEEIVQDVLSRAAVRWTDIGQLDRPGAWIRRAVINDAISAWRRRDTERRAVERLSARPLAQPSTPADPGHELWAAVRELPEVQCRAIALHYGADVSLADVALELDLTPAATKTVLYRARRTLRERLDSDRNEE